MSDSRITTATTLSPVANLRISFPGRVVYTMRFCTLLAFSDEHLSQPSRHTVLLTLLLLLLLQLLHSVNRFYRFYSVSSCATAQIYQSYSPCGERGANVDPPHPTDVSFGPAESAPDGISICSAAFAGLAVTCLLNRQTRTETTTAECAICSNSPRV